MNHSRRQPSATASVLVVDEDVAVRRLAHRVLQRHGFRVVTAEPGVAALDTFRAHQGRIAVIVSDVAMPLGPALQLYGALRRSGRRVRFVFGGGSAPADVWGRIAPEARVALLPKPWTSPELLRRVREALADA